MRKLGLGLIAALITFLLGLAAVNEYQDGLNLSNLSTFVLPKDDLEVRLWYDGFAD